MDSLRCLKSEESSGLASSQVPKMSARNIGIHAASGELVAHLDDDDLYAPGSLPFWM